MSITVSRTRFYCVLISITTALVVAIALTGCRRSSESGKVYETWEASNDRFTVRAKASEDRSQALGGSYFVYESAPRGNDHWKQIMEFRHDDPIKIPHESIRFVGDRIGYVFLGWKYAVTSDGGQTWTNWSAESDLPNWKCCNYGLISEVELSAQGRGKMTLHTIPGRNEPDILQTEDYGKHWRR